jgi:hypothetical protein
MEYILHESLSFPKHLQRQTGILLIQILGITHDRRELTGDEVEISRIILKAFHIYGHKAE